MFSPYLFHFIAASSSSSSSLRVSPSLHASHALSHPIRSHSLLLACFLFLTSRHATYVPTLLLLPLFFLEGCSFLTTFARDFFVVACANALTPSPTTHLLQQATPKQQSVVVQRYSSACPPFTTPPPRPRSFCSLFLALASLCLLPRRRCIGSLIPRCLVKRCSSPVPAFSPPTRPVPCSCVPMQRANTWSTPLFWMLGTTA